MVMRWLSSIKIEEKQAFSGVALGSRQTQSKSTRCWAGQRTSPSPTSHSNEPFSNLVILAQFLLN